MTYPRILETGTSQICLVKNITVIFVKMATSDCYLQPISTPRHHRMLILTLKLKGPAAGVSGSLTVPVA